MREKVKGMRLPDALADCIKSGKIFVQKANLTLKIVEFAFFFFEYRNVSCYNAHINKMEINKCVDAHNIIWPDEF